MNRLTQDALVNQLLQHRDSLLGFILALTRDYGAAEEVFQEVAKVILEEKQRGTAVEQFMPWAREIARRRVGEYYRGHARRHAGELLASSMDEMACQAFAENERIQEASSLRFKALLECLEKLAGRSRQVVEGFYRQGKSIREIAAGMGWTENSVKSALWRSRKLLADCIRGKMESQEKSR